MIEINPVGEIIRAVGNIADDLITTKEERLKSELDYYKIDAELASKQIEVNIEEAKHKSLFVAGWRPAVGWVGVFALAYVFVFHNFGEWIWLFLQSKGYISLDVSPPPTIDATILMQLLFGILGLGAFRSYEKKQGIHSDSLNTKNRKGGFFRKLFKKQT